jgi:hypothetical protein
MATPDQVEAFLKNLREKIRFFDVAFRPRDKNLKFLANIDLIPIERIDYLKKLTYENYKSGPNKDTHEVERPDYWEFGIEIKGVEAYIKVSLGLKDKRVDCMSFHEAELSITYPLKERKL